MFLKFICFHKILPRYCLGLFPLFAVAFVSLPFLCSATFHATSRSVEYLRKEEESNLWAINPPWYSKPVADHQQHLPYLSSMQVYREIIRFFSDRHRTRRCRYCRPHQIQPQRLAVTASWGDRRELNPLILAPPASPASALGSSREAA
jgi:hypothetical protein